MGPVLSSGSHAGETARHRHSQPAVEGRIITELELEGAAVTGSVLAGGDRGGLPGGGVASRRHWSYRWGRVSGWEEDSTYNDPQAERSTSGLFLMLALLDHPPSLLHLLPGPPLTSPPTLILSWQRLEHQHRKAKWESSPAALRRGETARKGEKISLFLLPDPSWKTKTKSNPSWKGFIWPSSQGEGLDRGL